MTNNTKQHLINCAEILFRDKGFKKTRVIDITQSAGVAKGTFYLYFETKNAILDEIIIEGFVKRFFSIIESAYEEKKPEEFIDYIIDKSVELIMENEGLMEVAHNGDTLNEVSFTNFKSDYIKYGVERFFIEMSEKYIIYIKNVLDEGIRLGIFREVDTELYSRMLFCIVHNTIEFSHFHNVPSDIKTVSKELKVIIRLILRKD